MDYTEPMEPAAVLFANEAFYLAFSHKDLDSMERLWAVERPVICIHPGWSALMTRDEIIESWRGILQNTSIGIITPHHARVMDFRDFSAVVCYEKVQGQMLVATNLFVEEAGEIRLIFHQASACADPPAPEPLQITPLQ
jgi:hypothetical protein